MEKIIKTKKAEKMRKIYYILVIMIIVMSSCNSKWDDYYFGTSNTEENMDMTIAQYLASHPEYSKFNEMLTKTGLTQELGKEQQITLWVPNNTAMDASGISENDTSRMKYHMNHLPFLRTDLKNGFRLS